MAKTGLQAPPTWLLSDLIQAPQWGRHRSRANTGRFCLSLCLSAKDDTTRKRLGKNVPLLWRGCAPAGSEHALSWFGCYCFPTPPHARPDERAILVIVLWFGLPSCSYPHNNARRITHATPCMLQNSRQLLNFVYFMFSGRCWLWKFWTEILIEHFSEVLGFTTMSWKDASEKKGWKCAEDFNYF